MLSVFLFLLFIYGVSDKETEESELMTVMEGDSVTLHTNLTEVLNDDTILWLFGPKDLLISQIRRRDDFTPVFFTDDAGFTGRLQVDQKTGSLTIRNTRIRHSGQYKLSVSRETTTTKIFNVTVFGVVSKTDGIKSESVSVMEGKSVTLRNDAEIRKDALMLWRFGDKGVLLAKIDIEANETSLHDADERFRDRLQLDLQTGSLTITNTRTTDSGLYELQIRGIESSRRFLLSVSAVPEPQFSSGAKAAMDVGFLVLVLLLVAAALAAFYYRHRIFKLKKKMDEEKKSMMEGDSPTLLTGLANIQGIDTIEWCYEAEDNRIAKINRGTIKKSSGADGRFRSKLRLDDKTGDLTISNIRTIHSGLYILKISSSSSKSGCGTKSTTRTKRKRFIVTVSVRTLKVKMEDSVTLKIDAEIQSDDLMLWTFGPENRLVVKTDSGRTSISESFRDRLELNKETGWLIIRNIGITDSGHFKLQIINSKQTTFRRFNVTVSGSTEEQVNDVTQLISEDVPDGVNEQQATSSV